MAELERIGHNIELKNIVIHKINKSAGPRIAVLKLATKPLAISVKESLFIGKVIYNYDKNTRPTFGIFEDDQSNKFIKSLKGYLVSEKDFFVLTCESMEYYREKIKDVSPATGGFVLFANYFNTTNSCNYLLVLTLNNKDGYFFNEESLTLEDVKNLDINKIDVASIINLTKWEKVLDNKGEDIKTYLSFVRGNKDVSLYFMNFIGCENKTTSTNSSKKLVKALTAFCNSKGYDKEKEISLKNKVHGYCHDCISNKKEILLDSISSIINIDNPNEFSLFASDETYSVDDVISGDKRILKLMKYVRYKSDKLTLEFSNELLSSKQIVYDEIKNELLITNLPTSIREQILE